MRVRFAPSPTGQLHVGNARMALINFLHARRGGGAFILRMDDTDDTRSTPEFADGIRADLTWLGLEWDEEFKQSDRFAAYETARQTLINAGRLYPCYETPEELNLKRKRLLNAGKPPIYDRSALDLSGDQIAAYEAEGRKPHWRFKLADGTIAWEDLVRGPVSFQASDLSDPVVIREDGRFLYMLPSTVDDVDMGITDVLRGEDHVNNTAVQIQMFEALGGEVPKFGHFSLLAGAQGEALSKRLGSLSLDSMRSDGILPSSVVCMLARLGTPDPVEPTTDMVAVINGFDISRFGRATAKFNPEDLSRINAQIVHSLAYADVAEVLAEVGVTGPDADVFWTVVRANLETITGAADLWPIVSGPITPVIEDAAFAAAAVAALPDDLDDQAWSTWTGTLKVETGRKGKALFMPLRQALTGQNHGPELAPLLPLIGREKILARLNGETA